jgi:hypothetical protein
MAVITGGQIIAPPGTGNVNPGLKNRIYKTTGVPTDAAIGVTAANAMLAEDVATGNVYERQAGAWVRVDTL